MQVLFHYAFDPPEFHRFEMPGVGDLQRIQPKFGLDLVPLDVNMRGLSVVCHVIEEAIGAGSQDSWQSRLRGAG